MENKITILALSKTNKRNRSYYVIKLINFVIIEQKIALIKWAMKKKLKINKNTFFFLQKINNGSKILNKK
jgi:hypothetical protein